MKSGGYGRYRPSTPTAASCFSLRGAEPRAFFTRSATAGPGGRIGIAEGWATSAAIHAATGHPVAVAFSASNMENIARIVKGLFPGNQIVVWADDDRKDGSTDPNVGIEAATRAALAVGGALAVPNTGKKADFGDVLNELGPKRSERPCRSA